MIQHGRDFSLLTASREAIRAQRTMYQALSGAYDDNSRDGFRRDEDGCMLNSLAICGVVPYITEWKGRSEARRISTHFFEQTLRVHELGVSLQSRHALDEPDTGGVQRAHHEPSQAGGQGGSAFPVTCRNVVPVPNMFDGIFQVLF